MSLIKQSVIQLDIRFDQEVLWAVTRGLTISHPIRYKIWSGNIVGSHQRSHNQSD